jgi:uncharacterized lipoprotein YajG
VPAYQILLLCGLLTIAGCARESASPRPEATEPSLAKAIGRRCMVVYENGADGKSNQQGILSQADADWVLIFNAVDGVQAAIPTQRVIEINFIFPGDGKPASN